MRYAWIHTITKVSDAVFAFNVFDLEAHAAATAATAQTNHKKKTNDQRKNSATKIASAQKILSEAIYKRINVTQVHDLMLCCTLFNNHKNFRRFFVFCIRFVGAVLLLLFFPSCCYCCHSNCIGS